MNTPNLPTKAFCINLDDRIQKFYDTAQRWEKSIEVIRFAAIDTRPKGQLGCFQSHQRVLLNYLADPDCMLGNPLFILEDDAVPCSDFAARLPYILKAVPERWDIIMLGYWPTVDPKFTMLNEFIAKAENNILATHCYLVNTRFAHEFADFLHNFPEKQLDHAFRILQKRYNVYMAMPSCAYQVGVYSDTGNGPVDYAGTKTYFKDCHENLL